MTKTNKFTDKINLEMPDINKLQCKNCAFRAEDRLNGKIKGAVLAICQVFPGGKPEDVSWGKAECPYYVDENEDDE